MSNNPTPSGPAAADAAVLTEQQLIAMRGRYAGHAAYSDLRRIVASHEALAAERDRLRHENERLRLTKAALMAAIYAVLEEYPKVSYVLVDGQSIMDIAAALAPHAELDRNGADDAT